MMISMGWNLNNKIYNKRMTGLITLIILIIISILLLILVFAG